MPSTRSLPARVIVADDYPLFRDGLRRVVRRYLPQAAVSEAGSFDEVLRLASSVSPEPPALFVLDLLLPGFAASQSIAEQGIVIGDDDPCGEASCARHCRPVLGGGQGAATPASTGRRPAGEGAAGTVRSAENPFSSIPVAGLRPA